MTDEELAAGMARGDQASFEAFIYRYHGPLLRYLDRMLQDERKAEDFVQEVFLRLFRQIKERKIPEKIRPWLYHVASNLCKDEWRKGKNHREKLSDGFTPELPDHSPAVAQIYERKEEKKRVLNALQQLSEKERELVILRFYQELKLTEMAQVMGMPVGTVKSTLHYTMTKLKRILIDEEQRADAETEEQKGKKGNLKGTRRHEG